MRKFAMFTLVALMLAAFAVPAGANHTSTAASCKVTWGSLAKSSATTSAAGLTGVRAGRHQCYDRIVIDLNGPVTGYQVEYVDQVTMDGSGQAVTVTGGAKIQIVAYAVAYDSNGNATVEANAVDATNVSGFSTFRDVAWAGSFEGQTTLGLGVRARLPFRVFTLAGPGNGSRMVIDVAHHW